MDMTLIADLVQVSLPTGLIIFGCWFLVDKLWPWWVEEREFQRDYKKSYHEAEHVAQHAMASAINNLASSVVTCPLKQPGTD